MSMQPEAPRFDSKAYALYRPTYPPALYHTVYQYHRSHGGRFATAVDVATGSGQAAAELAKAFDHVIGLDASATQLAEAAAVRNVHYTIATAESLSVPDASADLVTVAQGAHWFELPRFFQEVQRVVVPTGTLALWMYGLAQVDESPPFNALLRHFYEDTVGPYWNSRRKLIDRHYTDIVLPFKHAERRELDMHKQWSLREFTLYLKSWSSYHRYRELLADRPDPADAFLTQ